MVENKIQIAEKDRDGAEIGRVILEPDKKRAGGHYLRDLHVVEEHRGCGIGTSLLRRALEQAGGRVSLEVDQSNTHALDLYLRMGFKIVETVNSKNGQIFLRMQM